MEVAFELAQEALDAAEVPIGCCIHYRGELVATGRNRTNELGDATRHAEMEALPQALAACQKRGISLSECVLTVTVEPCIMCIAACRLSGLTSIYAAARNERFGGCGSVAPADTAMMGDVPAAAVEWASGAFRTRAVHMLRRFYLCENERAPNPKRKANRVFKPCPGDESV